MQVPLKQVGLRNTDWRHPYWSVGEMIRCICARTLSELQMDGAAAAFIIHIRTLWVKEGVSWDCLGQTGQIINPLN